MKCPHCQADLTLREAIIILNGSGYRRIAKIRLPSGQIAFQEAGKVNPVANEVLDW